MWSNDGWAKAHLAKRHPDVSTAEAWEAIFEGEGAVLVAPDQIRYPPFRRYWLIERTRAGRRLLVVWEQWREIKNLITAYPPSEEQIKVYEAKTKKIRR